MDKKNLRDADLSGADLCGANLRSIYLNNADLRETGLAVIQVGKFTATILQDAVFIGCKKMKTADLLSFSQEDVKELDEDAGVEFKKYGELLKIVIRYIRGAEK